MPNTQPRSWDGTWKKNHEAQIKNQPNFKEQNKKKSIKKQWKKKPSQQG